MGYRANVVVRCQGNISYFGTSLYDPMPVLFLGETNILTWAKTLKVTLDELSPLWEESGILIDYDTRNLAYFGGDDIIWMPNARNVFNAFLEEEIWRGWHVTFCPRQLNDFAKILDIDPPKRAYLHRDASDKNDLHIRLQHLDRPENDSIIVVRNKDERFIHSLATSFVTELLEYGPELATALNFPGIDSLVSKTDFLDICSSILIDCELKQIWYWAIDDDTPLRHYERAWEGWKIVDLGEDFDTFSQLTEGAISFDHHVDLKLALDFIRKENISHHDREHMIEPDMLEAMIDDFTRTQRFYFRS